jgi:hypothetical protein
VAVSNNYYLFALPGERLPPVRIIINMVMKVASRKFFQNPVVIFNP